MTLKKIGVSSRFLENIFRSWLKLFSSNDQNQSEKYKKHPKKLKKENGLPKEKKETNSDYDKNDMIYVKYWWTLFKLIFIYFQNEEELSDFTVEIEILHELRHENIIGLLDAYYHNNQLWVSKHISVVYIFRISHNSKLDEARPAFP